MSFHQLNDLVNKANKAIYDNEKFVVNGLAVRAKRMTEANPYDQTVIGMSNFLSKRANSNAMFITRAELKDVYNRLYTSNNRFAEAFSEELGEGPKLLMPKVATHSASENVDFLQESYEKHADPILSNALASAFDKSIPVKVYSNETAKSAERSCFHELNRNGLPPKKITVVAGQPDVLICQVSYDTPKGESHVLVPVEIREKRALIPTVFLSREGFLDITAADLENHIVTTGGKSFQINVQELLNVVSNAKNPNVVEGMNDVERAVMNFAATKETPVNHTIDGILYQEVDKYAGAVELPEFEQPQELQDFGTRMTSQAGQAELIFGKSAVDMGRKIITQAMSKMGYKQAQIGIAGMLDGTVLYAVAVDNKSAFKVPVKIENKKVVAVPDLLISSGSVMSFTKESISELLTGDEQDIGTMAAASPMYDLKPSDLVEQVRVAMDNSDYLKAEDALTVLKTKGDDKAFKVAFEIYSAGLGGKIVKTASGVTCTMQHKNASSKHVICGHTNLPIHKVYQDKNGDCQPMYRKGMAESYEGASFLNSKIFLES